MDFILYLFLVAAVGALWWAQRQFRQARRSGDEPSDGKLLGIVMVVVAVTMVTAAVFRHVYTAQHSAGVLPAHLDPTQSAPRIPAVGG